jgi:imidazole glycerol-phosphate synthase subunit HisF
VVAKRIIACLDVHDGQVVKGVQFQDLKAMGDPVQLAARYGEQGADEVTFLDISATVEGRATLLKTVEETAKQLFVPLTVGGGVRTVDDARRLLRAGADKVAINTAAIENPSLIQAIARDYGVQCVVVAIDAKREGARWNVHTHGGKKDTGKDALEWARKAAELGAGEILLTSIDADGTKMGYDLELTRKVSESVRIPVVASGGCGSNEDALNAFVRGKADAALVASLFHTGQETPDTMKRALAEKGVEVRL